MRRLFFSFLTLVTFLFVNCKNDRPQSGVGIDNPSLTPPVEYVSPIPPDLPVPSIDVLKFMNKKFVDVKFEVPLDNYTEEDKAFLQDVITASDYIDTIYWQQTSDANDSSLASKLRVGRTFNQLDERDQELARLVEINYGRFDRLNAHVAFIGAGIRSLGAEFYPLDVTKEEFEALAQASPVFKADYESAHTLIRRTASGGFGGVPYSIAYYEELRGAVWFLRRAADSADSPSMAKFLSLRADAFKTNDYRASDEAWVKVEGSKFEIVIGPYETYEDRLNGYKAAFEAFVTVTDPQLSAELGKIRAFLPDMEKALPLDEQYRGYERAKGSPVFAVDLVYSAGDARKGIQVSAFNLPNDEDVRQNVGTKNVLLRNMQKAKFEKSLKPISEVVLTDEQAPLVTWDAYFKHNLLHELSHGMGPGKIQVDGSETTVSKALKELYGPIEELKADAVGFWAVGYLVDRKFFDPALINETAVMSLAGFFRAVRFGLSEAHGLNNLIYYNFLTAEGVYNYNEVTGRFIVATDKFLPAVTKLAHEVLTLEARGDYAATQEFIKRYGQVPNEAVNTVVKLDHIPVDIHPIYVTADQLKQQSSTVNPWQ